MSCQRFGERSRCFGSAICFPGVTKLGRQKGAPAWASATVRAVLSYCSNGASQRRVESMTSSAVYLRYKAGGHCYVLVVCFSWAGFLLLVFFPAPAALPKSPPPQKKSPSSSATANVPSSKNSTLSPPPAISQPPAKTATPAGATSAPGRSGGQSRGSLPRSEFHAENSVAQPG